MITVPTIVVLYSLFLLFLEALLLKKAAQAPMHGFFSFRRKKRFESDSPPPVIWQTSFTLSRTGNTAMSAANLSESLAENLF